MMEFKDRLKELRNEKRISALSIAEKLGKAESTIRMWEIGKAKPDVDTLIELSKTLDCTVDYLLGISDFQNGEVEKQYVNKITNLELIYKNIKQPYKNELTQIFEIITSLFIDLEKINNNDLLDAFNKDFKDVTKAWANISTVVSTLFISKKSFDRNEIEELIKIAIYAARSSEPYIDRKLYSIKHLFINAIYKVSGLYDIEVPDPYNTIVGESFPIEYIEWCEKNKGNL